VITYLDSSVLLRHILGQPGALDLAGVGRPVASVLTRVECRRTLDRVRLRAGLAPEEHLLRVDAAAALLRRIHLAPMDESVLARAEGPLAVPLGTLDAIHLATALFCRESSAEPFRFATHDLRLAGAARMHGLEVVGG